MRNLRLADFVSRTGLYLVLSPPFFALEDLYISECHYSRPYWQDDIENTLWLQLLQPFATEESLLIKGVRATYHAFPARACQGKDDRSLARPAEHFLGGAGDVRTCPGGHSAIRCRATSQSPHSGFSLGQTELVQKFDD